MTVILVFPEATSPTNRSERHNVNLYVHVLHYTAALRYATLKEFVVKYGFQCPWILENWVSDPASISSESVRPRNSC